MSRMQLQKEKEEEEEQERLMDRKVTGHEARG